MQERKENDMSAHDQLKQNTSDPLGLSDLEAIEPGYDGWAHIESALQAHQNNKRNWQRAGGWLAVAASLVLVISISLRNTENDAINSLPSPEFATPATNLASVPVQDNINALIGLSQNMESQVKRLREETTSMPAESAIYVAELEDLIAQVDNELSLTPDSIDLWGQRVNLMLDLAQIYQQQWEIDYGRMASL
jgi:hypothetical protein